MTQSRLTYVRRDNRADYVSGSCSCYHGSKLWYTLRRVDEVKTPLVVHSCEMI